MSETPTNGPGGPDTASSAGNAEEVLSGLGTFPTQPDSHAVQGDPINAVGESEPGRIPEYKQDAIAAYGLAGIDASIISNRTGVKESTIKRYLAGHGPKHFTDKYDGYRRQLLRQQSHHYLELSDMAADAYTALKEAMRGQNMSLRVETAWKLLEILHPPIHQPDMRMDVNVGFQQNNTLIQGELGSAFTKVADALTETLAATSKLQPGAHELMGKDALPSAHKIPAPANEQTVVSQLEPVPIAPDEDQLDLFDHDGNSRRSS